LDPRRRGGYVEHVKAPKNNKRDPSPSDPGMTFEQALARLEAIVQRIESGEVGLERSIAEYEQGVALIRRCKDILEKAEQRVEVLSRAAGLPKSGSEESDRDGER